MHHHTGIHLLITTGIIDQTNQTADFFGLTSTSDLDKYAISTTVNKAIPKSERFESTPISDETVALIKEKRRLGDNTLKLRTRL